MSCTKGNFCPFIDTSLKKLGDGRISSSFEFENFEILVDFVVLFSKVHHTLSGRELHPKRFKHTQTAKIMKYRQV